MIEWPINPRLWEQFSYVDPISGCGIVTWEWCGIAGWRYIGMI